MTSSPRHLTAPDRFYALDALRAFAMFLGITLHTAIAFQTVDTIPWPGGTNRQAVFDLHNLVVHSFRLQMFFLVAGFFARLVIARRGVRLFLWNRTQRILIPWVFGMVTLVPFTLWIYWHGMTGSAPFATWQVTSDFARVTAHLWFLQYLLLLYAGALLLRAGLRPILSEAFHARADGAFRWLMRSPASRLGLAVPTLAIFSFSDVWIDIGLPVGLAPIPRVLAYYSIFFGAGWLLHRNSDLLPVLEKNTRRSFAWAGLFLLLLLACLPVAPQLEHPHFAWFKLGAMTAYNLFTWTIIFAVAGVFFRIFRRSNATVRYCADASYWFYLAHLPIVLFLQAHWQDSTWPAPVQFGLILTVTMLVLLASYHWGVRYTWIGTMLNGKRTRVPARHFANPPARATQSNSAAGQGVRSQ